MLNIICVGILAMIFFCKMINKEVVTKSSDFELNPSGNTGFVSGIFQ